jgi:hypothetical protein
MSRGSKILLLLIGVAALLSIGITFYRYYVIRDFLIATEVPCDPMHENCFVRHCTVDDWDICDFIHKKYTRYYKIVTKPASNMSLCNQNTQQCPPVSCGKSEESCEVITCTEGYNEDSCSNARPIHSLSGAKK